MDICENLHSYYSNIESRLKAEGFKSRVCNVIHAWEEWTIYPKEFLAQLRAKFLGKPVRPEFFRRRLVLFH